MELFVRRNRDIYPNSHPSSWIVTSTPIGSHATKSFVYLKLEQLLIAVDDSKNDNISNVFKFSANYYLTGISLSKK